MKPIWLIGLVVVGVAGCVPAEKMAVTAAQPPAASNVAPPEKTVTRQAIEGFTGKTAVDAGERTKAKIKGINTQRRQNFEEIPP